jgi:hypothetical protein
MPILRNWQITDGNDTVIATGNDGTDDDNKTIQVVVDQDNGLQLGAFYKITLGDGTGYRSICYKGPSAGFAEFAYETSNAF